MFKHDLPVLDEQHVGEDVFDLLDLVRGHEDGAFLVEVVVQQVVVERAAEQQVEAERGLVEHQQLRVDRENQRQVQLRDHALGELADAAVLLDVGAGEEFLGALAIEARVHAGDEVHRLRNLDPARQHRHVGDETHFVHEGVALRARIEAEHLELAIERGEPEDGLDHRGLAGAVRADQADDAARFHVEIHASNYRRIAVALGETASFNYCCHLHRLWRRASGTAGRPGPISHRVS